MFLTLHSTNIAIHFGIVLLHSQHLKTIGRSLFSQINEF